MMVVEDLRVREHMYGERRSSAACHSFETTSTITMLNRRHPTIPLKVWVIHY